MTRLRWNPRRGLPAAALVGIAAVVLGACAGQDADRDDVINAVEEAQGPDDEMPADYPDCVADGFFETFDQDEINDLANAQTVEDFPEENDVGTDAVQIMETCWETDGQSFEAGGESAESTESTESTDTTTAGESTTTTAATE